MSDKLPPCDHDSCPAAGCESTPETDAVEAAPWNPRTVLDKCRALELERNRLRERVAALERPRDSLVFGDVAYERDSQERKWGEQNHALEKWLVILGEEFGEACEETLNTDGAACRHELVQVAAVAVAAIECMDRAMGRIPEQHPAPVAPAADAAPVPTPPLQWYPLFKHMSDEHGLSLLDSELHEIALKADESRAAAQPAPVPATAPALTREQRDTLRVASGCGEHELVIGRREEMAGMVSAGLLQEPVPGAYRITEAGRRALREQGEAK